MLDRLPSIEAALATNGVVVKKVQASSVVVIRPLEDEDVAYLFEVDQDRVLFLMGDRYTPVCETMPWPNTEFEIVRSSDGQVWIGVFCHGSALQASRVIEGRAFHEHVLLAEHEELVRTTAGAFAEEITRPAEDACGKGPDGIRR
jgi:hypothetical protein